MKKITLTRYHQVLAPIHSFIGAINCIRTCNNYIVAIVGILVVYMNLDYWCLNTIRFDMGNEAQALAMF